MSHINTIMNQLLTFVPRHHFDTAVNQYSGNYYTKTFSCWNQFYYNVIRASKRQRQLKRH